MLSFPPCKINLGLHVIRKREDGYHELDTCFFPVPWTDILEVVPAAQTTFTSTGYEIPGDPNNNLCLKAYTLLQKDFNLSPIAIHLHKNIPMGAGLGGGSSDGAHMLRLLNAVFALNLSTEILMHYAAQLGSDCAFFIQDRPMHGTGRGEILSPLNITLAGKYLVLIKPDVHVSTAEAYQGVRPHKPALSIPEIINKPIREWRTLLVNDFEQSVSIAHPRLQEIKMLLYERGAIYAAMSGSGSTLFGIFEHPIEPFDLENCVTWASLLVD